MKNLEIYFGEHMLIFLLGCSRDTDRNREEKGTESTWSLGKHVLSSSRC